MSGSTGEDPIAIKQAPYDIISPLSSFRSFLLGVICVTEIFASNTVFSSSKYDGGEYKILCFSFFQLV
jgi:hypothetical protein